ncbi:MAG: hypothetical protein ACAI25_01215, partial [Planctomycetota bacterium]
MRRLPLAALAGVAALAFGLFIEAGRAGADDWKDEHVEGSFALEGTQGGKSVKTALSVRKARPGAGFLVSRRTYDESGALTVLHGTGERQGSELSVE